MMGKQNCECSCCHRRHAHLQLVKGYQQGVHRGLKQNITTKDKNEYESDFGDRSRVGGHVMGVMLHATIFSLFVVLWKVKTLF